MVTVNAFDIFNNLVAINQFKNLIIKLIIMKEP